MLVNKQTPPQTGIREQADQRQAAAYICDLLLELRLLARTRGLRHLTYLLELAIYEAFGVANDREPQPTDFRRTKQQPGA